MKLLRLSSQSPAQEECGNARQDSNDDQHANYDESDVESDGSEVVNEINADSRVVIFSFQKIGHH